MTESLAFVDVPAKTEHKATVIWLHGLGDSGNGFAPIVPQLQIPDALGIRFMFPHAPVRAVTINNHMPMRAWYDIKSLEIDKRADVEGVLESAAAVKQLLDTEIASGIPSNKILLAGFSQGGVIAYQLGIRYEQPLAGVLALSTYLSQADKVATEGHPANQNTPILCQHGSQDPVVPLALGKMAFDTLKQAGYAAQWQEYPMEHNVCLEQLQDISRWIQQRLS